MLLTRMNKLLDDLEAAHAAVDDIETAIRSEDPVALREAGLVLERIGCYARRTGATSS